MATKKLGVPNGSSSTNGSVRTDNKRAHSQPHPLNHSKSQQTLGPNNRTARTTYGRYSSAPFSQAEAQKQPEHSAAFPKSFTYCGYLDIRMKTNKPWKRRYFVVNNNFLLCAATPHAQRLEGVYPLEGSSVDKRGKKKKSGSKSPTSPPESTYRSQSSSTSDMTFELFIRKHQLFFRAASPQQCAIWKEHITTASKLKIKDIYRFLYTLGTSESQMTKVVAAKHRTTNDDCAIKIVDKRNCESKMLKTEIQILKKLDNPYIVQLYDIFETKKYLYIVMEKCLGGELFDQIAELDGDHYTEQDCCLIMHQIARGVKYMHSQGIVHRDLKPENILCVHPESIKKVKLADFGISKMVSSKNKNGKNGKNKQKQSVENLNMHTIVGTMSYTAPEILRGKGYDHSVDFWSIGVIMFILLCGYPPFWGQDDNAISRSILKDELVFEDEDWEHVTPETKELVKGLLNKDATKRYTCSNVLKLAWKVSSKNTSFKKSRIKFKEHVLQRKFHRHSMGAFEQNSSIMNRMHHKPSNDTTNNNMQKNEIINKNNKYVKAWSNRRGSKTTDEIMELHLPYNKRESMNPNFETDDDIKKRKKKESMKQHTFEEDDFNEDDYKNE